MKTKNGLIALAFLLVILAPGTALAGIGERGGSGSPIPLHAVSIVANSLISSLSTTLLAPSFHGSNPTPGDRVLDPVTPCTDPNSSGMRYCNFVFDEDQIGITTYTYSKNVPKADSNGTEDLTIDVFAPTNDAETLRSMVIFAHGGGGEKDNASIVNWCKNRFARRGYVCGSIDYRGSSDVAGEFTGALQNIALSDMQAAIRWARDNSTILGIDPNKIILMGSSAGAITAIQASVMGNNLDVQNVYDDPKINTTHSGEPSWSCFAVTLSGAVNNQIMNYIDKNDPPAAMYHGVDDQKVYYTGAVATRDAMIALGIPTTLLSFPDTGHNLDGHIDEIVMDLYPKLYASVAYGTCPQAYSNLVAIGTNGNGNSGGDDNGGGSSGGGGGGIIIGGGSTSNDAGNSATQEEKPSVLDADAETVACPYLTKPILIGKSNDLIEVKKLEMFLNAHEGENLAVDGIYSMQTIKAVQRFQKKYAGSLPTLPGINLPLGNVGTITKAEINILSCMPQPVICPAFKEYNSVTTHNDSPEIIGAKTVLHALGVYEGAMDTHFSQEFKNALTSFQRTFPSFMLTPGKYSPGTKSILTNKFFNKLLGCNTPPVVIGKKLFTY